MVFEVVEMAEGFERNCWIGREFARKIFLSWINVDIVDGTWTGAFEGLNAKTARSAKVQKREEQVKKLYVAR